MIETDGEREENLCCQRNLTMRMKLYKISKEYDLEMILIENK